MLRILSFLVVIIALVTVVACMAEQAPPPGPETATRPSAPEPTRSEAELIRPTEIAPTDMPTPAAGEKGEINQEQPVVEAPTVDQCSASVKEPT